MNCKQRKDFRRMATEPNLIFTYHYDDCSEHVCNYCFSKHRDIHWDNCLQDSDWQVTSINMIESYHVCRTCNHRLQD
jgi:hypothetical protein